MWNLKTMTQINLFTKQKQTHRLREQEWGGHRDRSGIWDEYIHTAIFKEDNHQGPTV